MPIIIQGELITDPEFRDVDIDGFGQFFSQARIGA